MNQMTFINSGYSRYVSIIIFYCLFVYDLDGQGIKEKKTGFVKVQNYQLMFNGSPYYFIGANYWYGGLLALSKDQKKGKLRLAGELDFLKASGVNNLRVLCGSEGAGKINGVERIKPSLQPSRNVFDQEILKALDFFLMELGKRKMHCVLYLSNNWEWSGGFLQYLNWNDLIDNDTLKRKLNWDEQRDYTSKFYTCSPCKSDYLAQLDLILHHKNRYTGKTYINEPAIMAWELANEPRPMRPSAIDAYKEWIRSTSEHIKKADKNHLVTIGTEGMMGTEESTELFKDIHSIKSIDYLTIHIWPKNWGWFKGDAIAESLPQLTDKTRNYITQHEAIALELKKPLVIEEFGLPRDHHSFDPASSTSLRDQYYTSIFDLWKKSRNSGGAIAGCNFWGFGGRARPVKGQVFWKDGDEYTADPPMEEQGLNTVFDSDKTTWTLIRTYLKE